MCPDLFARPLSRAGQQHPLLAVIDWIPVAQGLLRLRTLLEGERSFGGELLPEPAVVAVSVRCVVDGTPIGTPERPLFRQYTDLGDGADEALAAYGR